MHTCTHLSCDDGPCQCSDDVWVLQLLTEQCFQAEASRLVTMKHSMTIKHLDCNLQAKDLIPKLIGKEISFNYDYFDLILILKTQISIIIKGDGLCDAARHDHQAPGLQPAHYVRAVYSHTMSFLIFWKEESPYRSRLNPDYPSTCIVQHSTAIKSQQQSFNLCTHN